jgi:CDP-diacylglycerol---glycerol-3-phosphate 3-phosphatidyltransferase
LFDGNFRTTVDRYTKPVGAGLVKVGFTADRLTVLGVLVAIGCAYVIAIGHPMWGFVLLLGSGLPDLLDGPVAKASGMTSVRGAFFDSVCDRISDTLVLGGIAWWFADTQSPHLVVLPLALLGASQFLSYMRAKADVFGFDGKGGIMERAERVVALCFGLVFSQWLVQVLWVILGLTLITCVQRFAKIWKQATDENPVLAARRRETRPWARNLIASWNEADEGRRRARRERTEQQRLNRRRSRNG